MLLKKALLSADNLNNAFLSKTTATAQTIMSTLQVSGGAVTLKNTVLTDNASASYFRIDPQGNNVIIYDGVNNQQLSIYSSSGSENTYLTTINAASNQSYGLIDISGASVDHLEIGTNSGKHVKFPLYGIGIGKSATATDNFHMISDATSGRALRFYNGNHGAGTFLMSIQADGKVGIGRQPSTYKLEVEGDIFATGNVRVGGTNQLYFDSYGGGFNMTDTTWIRTTGSKSFYHASGTMRTDGTLHVGNSGVTLSVANGGNLAFDTNVLYGDATNNRVGINNSGPTQALDVTGSIKASAVIMAANGTGTRSIQGGDTNDSISLYSHANATWLRNRAGYWAFQQGTSADDWTSTTHFYIPAAGSTANAVWAELGQRQSNATDGRYRGVKITKYAGSAIVDGDLKTGTLYAVNGLVLPVGTNKYVTVAG